MTDTPATRMPLDQTARDTADPDAADRATAVTQSQNTLQQHWSAWCRDHGLDEHTPFDADPPVVFQVGLDHDHLSWIAIIHFHATAHGRRWHGIARGPLDGRTVFKIDRDPSPTGRPRRRAGRRRDAA